MIIVVVLVVILHKAGVLEILLSSIKKAPGSAETKMDTLTAYYNHDTTELLTEIRDEIRNTNKGIEKLLQMHQNYDVIGIKTRECVGK